MQQILREVEFAGRITAGLDVCDVAGEKVGTVAEVHRHTEGQTVVEIKTGFLGLGQHLYVPIASVQDMTSGCLFLTVGREAAVEHYAERPAFLDQST